MVAPRISSVSASTRIRIRPVGLALQDRAADLRHRHLGLEHPAAGRPRLGHGHPHPAERRVGEHRVRGDPAVDTCAVGLEQDLAVLVRGVGERAVAVDVAERPDARAPRSRTAVVDGEEAALVGLQPVGVAEQIDVGRAAGRDQQMRCRRPAGRRRARPRRRRRAARPGRSGPSTDPDALLGQHLRHQVEHVLVLPAGHAAAGEDGHLGAEPAEHLAELAARCSRRRR